MAQVIPSITSLPVDSGAAPSVEDIQDRLPSICVDYLSHNWTEEDVWASWRNMTRHKHEIANGVRLENASWRTWNKQRNKLRTISPETLNWLKDSDVTWLYGPLHTAKVEPVRPLRISTAQERLGIDGVPSSGKPGILKHRTLTELLAMPGQSSPVLEAERPEDGDDVILADVSTRAQIPHTKSDTHLARSNSMPVRRRSPSASLRRNANQSQERSPDSVNTISNKRHISFNTFVEQVIALDEPVIHRTSEDSDSSDDVLEMRLSRYSSHGSHNSRTSSMMSRTSSSSTIAKIPPGMLKTAGNYANNPTLPKLVYMPMGEYRTPPIEQPPAVTSPFQLASPVTVNSAGRRWSAVSQDDDFNNGFDYFGGPDLTGASPVAVPSPQTSTFARAPAVNPPPAQPKWRQAQTGDVSTGVGVGNSPSSSSSSSSLNAVVSPQPGRSILKVRAANNNPAPEPVSPPAVFNYNPSVATGIGGMFGGYEGAAQAGLAIGSPPTDDREERGRSSSSSEERGRSTSRGYGSSQVFRSASRNSSSSSVGSVSRSPVDTGVTVVKARVQSQPQLDKVQEGTPWAPAPTGGEPMDVDYSPERSLTPTPHSSPQIVFRPLKDTSPASLPHTSSRHALIKSVAGAPQQQQQQPPVTASPTDLASAVAQGQFVAPSATAVAPADVDADGDVTPAESSESPQPADDEDGSTLIGRATNIANTAKDLLGALWYGAQDDAARPRQPTPRRHQRGASLG